MLYSNQGIGTSKAYKRSNESDASRQPWFFSSILRSEPRKEVRTYAGRYEDLSRSMSLDNRQCFRTTLRHTNTGMYSTLLKIITKQVTLISPASSRVLSLLLKNYISIFPREEKVYRMFTRLLGLMAYHKVCVPSCRATLHASWKIGS